MSSLGPPRPGKSRRTYFFELLSQPLVLLCQGLDEDALLLLSLPLAVDVLRQGAPQLRHVRLQLVHPLVELLLGDLESTPEVVLFLLKFLETKGTIRFLAF